MPTLWRSVYYFVPSLQVHFLVTDNKPALLSIALVYSLKNHFIFTTLMLLHQLGNPGIIA